MSVESATYISDLNTANPTGADGKSEGDDHIRLLKSTIKATFPNINAAVGADDESLIKHNYVASSDPTVNDDSGDGYAKGSLWLNAAGGKLWGCSSASVGAASWVKIYPQSKYPLKYVSPYTVVYATTTSITIGALACRSSDDTYDINTSSYTKTIGGTFTAGNNQGALDDLGSVTASGTIHVFAIYDPTNDLADYLFSSSFSSPTLPGTYTKKAYLFSLLLNSSSQFIPFIYNGNDTFLYKDNIQDYNNVAFASTAAVLKALSVPIDIRVEAEFSFFFRAAPICSVQINCPDLNDPALGSTNVIVAAQESGAGNAALLHVQTDASKQVRLKVVSVVGSPAYDIWTRGYKLLR